MTEEQSNKYYQKLENDIKDNNLIIEIPSKEENNFQHRLLAGLLNKTASDVILIPNDKFHNKEYDNICLKYLNDEISFWRLCIDYIFPFGNNSIKTQLWADICICMLSLNEK